jgi:acetyltransferase-like isoleucine patch superfamily enzyme
MKQRFKREWVHFWMQRMGPGRAGRLASLLAGVFSPPYKGRVGLAHQFESGYIAPTAHVDHNCLQLGRHVFIGDRVVIYQRHNAGPVALDDYVELHRDVIIENGAGGSLTIGARTGVQPRCQFAAYVAPIMIGARVQIAPACAFYPYDHGMAPGVPMLGQPLTTRGPIIVEDDAWLGYGAVLLGGVRVGVGAVVGAGAVVTCHIPAGAIAVGVPARVVKMRDELPDQGAAIARAADQEIKG